MAAAAVIAARWAASAGSAARVPDPQAVLGPGPHVRVREHLVERGGVLPAQLDEQRPAGQEELVGGRPRPHPEQLQQLAALASLRLDQLRDRRRRRRTRPRARRSRRPAAGARRRGCPAPESGPRRRGLRGDDPRLHVLDDLLQISAVDRRVIEAVPGLVPVRVEPAAAAGDDRAPAAGVAQAVDAELPGLDGRVPGGLAERVAEDVEAGGGRPVVGDLDRVGLLDRRRRSR